MDFDHHENHGENSPFWIVENLQRNHITAFVNQIGDDDLVLISDADEIPNKDVIKSIYSDLHAQLGFAYGALLQEFFYYDLTHRNLNVWVGTIFSKAGLIKEKTAQWFRNNRYQIPHIKNAGWHLSYFGNVKHIIDKIENFAHQEFNNDYFKNPEHIKRQIENNKDLFERSGDQFELVDISLFPLDFLKCFHSQAVDHLPKLISHKPSKVVDSVYNFDSKITVIVPTMWKFKPFLNFVSELTKIPLIGEVLIINNAVADTPAHSVLDNDKISLYNFDQNTFVNPAWNFGVKNSRYDRICILNDDLIFDLKLINKIYEYLEPNKIFGLDAHTSFVDGSIDIDYYNGQNGFGFGCLMFLFKQDWVNIPDDLKIGYGDNWIFDTMLYRGNHNYLISNMLFYTPNSATMCTLDTNFAQQIYKKETEVYKKEIARFIDQKNK